MRMLYNQRKKLRKDTFFFGNDEKETLNKRHLLVSSFPHFTILTFEQRRLLRECIETYLLKTQYALLHRKSLFVQVPNIIEV